MREVTKFEVSIALAALCFSSACGETPTYDYSDGSGGETADGSGAQVGSSGTGGSAANGSGG